MKPTVFNHVDKYRSCLVCAHNKNGRCTWLGGCAVMYDSDTGNYYLSSCKPRPLDILAVRLNDEA